MQVNSHLPHQEAVHQPLKRLQCASVFSELPPELLFKIFSYLDAHELGKCRRVSREWNAYADDESLWKKLKPKIAFGRQEWLEYYGECESEPPLPKEIHQILRSPCPFWPGKKVEETHLLTLIPQSIDGKPLTLVSLGELVKKPKKGQATRCRILLPEVIDVCGQLPAISLHWVLMTRDMIPGSRDKIPQDQITLLSQFNMRAQKEYAVPSTLEAAICVLTHHVKTQERLLSNSPLTYTRCQETIAGCPVEVGAFSPTGLCVNNTGLIHDIYGLAAVQRFF